MSRRGYWQRDCPMGGRGIMLNGCWDCRWRNRDEGALKMAATAFGYAPASVSSVGNERMCTLTHTAIRISTTLPITNGTTTAAE